MFHIRGPFFHSLPTILIIQELGLQELISATELDVVKETMQMKRRRRRIRYSILKLVLTTWPRIVWVLCSAPLVLQSLYHSGSFNLNLIINMTCCKDTILKLGTKAAIQREKDDDSG